MLTRRPAQERGHANYGWLDTHYSFSFANYYDPQHMGFRHLRVINEDWISPGRGFGAHSHQDMEILTYILEGALEHRDSLGTGAIIKPGEAQRMTAGTGITHSEFNPSETEPVHLLQIWILPEQRGLQPSYEQRAFDPTENPGQLQLIASRDGRQGSVTIHQAIDIYTARLQGGDRITHTLDPNRAVWLQVLRGEIQLNGHVFTAGDGAAIAEEPNLELDATGEAEILLFDMA